MKSKSKIKSIFLMVFWIFLIFTPLNYINFKFSTNVFNKNQENSDSYSFNNQNLRPLMGEVLYSENFDDGIADNWVVIGGYWTIEASQYKVVGSDGERVRSYYNAHWFSDYTYEGDFKLIAGEEMQIIFNVNDIFNGDDMGHYCQITLFYEDYGMDRKDTAILYSTSNGQDEHIRVPFDFNYDQWYHFTIISTGNHVDFYLDGVLIISYSGVQYTSGYIGLKAMYGPIAYIDNIRVLNGSVIPFNQIVIIIAILIPIIAFVSIVAIILRKRAIKRKRQMVMDKVEVKIDDTIDVSKQEITEEQKETSEKPKVKDTIFAIKENDQMKLMKEEVGGSVQKTKNEISVSEQFTLGLEEKKLKKPSLQEPRDLSPIPKELKQEESEKLKVLRPEESLRVIEASKENRKETVVQTLEEKEKVIDKKITHFCTNCGKPLVNTWKICSYCGIRIRKELWDVEGKPETEISTIKKLEEPEVSLSKEIGKAGFKEKALIKSKELIREKLVPEKVLEEQIIVEEIKPIEHKPVKLEPLKNFCPFCGVENSLEQKRCKQCGYKFKQ